jgi:Putative peptidoglycan binding domain
VACTVKVNGRRALAGALLVLAAGVVAVVVSEPFAGSASPGASVADNASAITLVSVTRQPLASQTQVNGTLGYAGSSSVRVPAGMAPSAVQQDQQSLTSAQGMLQMASASLAADGEALATQRATLAAARAKESVDCAGDGAAEAASSPGGEGTPAASSGGGSGPCASDMQAVSTAQQGASSGAMKVKGDGSSVASAERALAGAEASLSTARSSAALYGQSSTFTALPAVGQVIARGQSLYQLGGQPVVLMFGSQPPTRAFIAGMSAGRDVAELNANLEALGYGRGLAGDTFTAATSAAIRALQVAHGLTVTGELLLGSVVFEPGPVRVTSVTPTVGQPVMPGPVLGVTSTARQVKVELDAAQQSSVKVGDAVTIALPTNETTPGVVTSVGTVASTPAKGGEPGGGEEGGPTIEVDVAPSDPAATGRLDQAPVSVSITSASVPSALVVPVDALLALAGGGYAVEAVEDGVHHLVAVTLGLFDDADGLVQVSGSGLRVGQPVVVPAS